MKIKFLPILIFCSLFSMEAQKIRVTYQSQTEMPEGDSYRIKNVYETRLDYHDGVEKYYYTTEPKNKELRKEDLKGAKNANKIDFSTGTHKIINHAHYRIIYRDRNKNQKITRIHRNDKDFLIEEKISIPLDWKFIDETKKIDKYECKLAEATFKGHTVRAWFAEEIPISSSPDLYIGLPGLVLEYKFGRKHVFVKSIDFKPDFDTIEPPTKGEKMTREEYKSYKHW